MSSPAGNKGAGKARPLILSQVTPERENVYVDVTSHEGPPDPENQQGRMFDDFPGRNLRAYELLNISELGVKQRRRIGTLVSVIQDYERMDEAQVTDRDYADYEFANRAIGKLMLVDESGAPIDPDYIEALPIGECITLAAKVVVDFFMRTLERTGTQRQAQAYSDSESDSGKETRERFRRRADWLSKQTTKENLEVV